MEGHVVLVGDSVFDNAAYTGGAPDVATHLRNVLGDAWKVTLLAIDGATTHSVFAQLSHIPDNATAVARGRPRSGLGRGDPCRLAGTTRSTTWTCS